MSTQKYADFISTQIEDGIVEAKQQPLTVKFKDIKTATKFTNDSVKAGVMNMKVRMDKVIFTPKNDGELFKAMKLIDKYNGTLGDK